MPSATYETNLALDKLPSAEEDASAEAERLQVLDVLHQLVEPLSEILPGRAEVVLHDLGELPRSIVAIHGGVTGRSIGDPATDMLLEQATSGTLDTNTGYATHLPDGRKLRSATIVVRDRRERPVATLCFNLEVDMWHELHALAASIIAADPTDEPTAKAASAEHTPAPSGGSNPDGGTSELFARDVDTLARSILARAIAEHEVPVALMRKEHKVAVVRAVKDRGFFHLRDAVEMVATELGVTRFTIYNYLNELADDSPTPGTSTGIDTGQRRT